jgi:hypothetical protein
MPKLSKALYVAACKLEPEPKPAPKPTRGAGNRKLTDEDVAEMRRLWETDRDNWSYAKLGEKFGINKNSVGPIVRYECRMKATTGGWIK